MFGLFKPKPKEQKKATIRLYNTATREKEEFTPLKPDIVTMYSCGPTVYNHMHVGNLRAYLLPDLLHRLLLTNGYKVNQTINFTDFGHLTDDADSGEDKMVKGMKREGFPITLEAMREFAETYIQSFKEDTTAFGNLPPSQYTRASDYIKQQIKLIETLEQKGYTYETSDGVYFDISKFPNYGVLGNIDLEKLKAGARVEINEEKHHPADFALWKKGDLGWQSRWGQGFPGWHIECAAMAFATLGKQIDVHTGGVDLMYTHHNGEIAEAECATGKTFVNYWLHNEHVTLKDEKLAKSTGNTLRLKDLEKEGYSPLTYRYWLLTSHYRTKVDFTFEALAGAKQAHSRLLRLVYSDLKDVKPEQVSEHYELNLMAAMGDDLDTPKAIALLWELIKDENLEPGVKLATLHHFNSLLGLGLDRPAEAGIAELGYIGEEDMPLEIQQLLDEREAARIAQNWPEADRLREAIQFKGYEIEDTDEGPKLSNKSTN